MATILEYDNESVTNTSILYVDPPWHQNFRDSTRFWVQHVFVPMVVLVGVIGNIITIFILTRRQMRTSSNIYLTALAISDLLFLIFSFSMSWQHYSALKTVKAYWKYVPVGLWLTDACSSTSVWITVSFTIERYIAVCHPMAGKAYCTERRAKYVALFVAMACALLTASTPFEWECSRDNSTYTIIHTSLGANKIYRVIYHWFTIVMFVILPLIILFVLNVYLINAVRKSRQVREKITNSHLHYQRRLQIMRQEDRITVTLIAVVILFLVTQVPTGFVLVYTASSDVVPEYGSGESNLLLAFGNICNLLMCLNAACNFLLYTALSDKYRRVFVNVLVVKGSCYFMRRRRERCRRIVYATPSRVVSGVSNPRSAPSRLLQGFVDCPHQSGTQQGQSHELNVLTLVRKKGISADCNCNGGATRSCAFVKQFQSI